MSSVLLERLKKEKNVVFLVDRIDEFEYVGEVKGDDS